MSKLSDYIDLNSIDLELKAESELEAIAKMIHLAERSGYVLNKKQIGEDLITHEILKPSLKGCCAVVFRVSSENAKSLHVFFGRFDEGIGYYSKKGHPVDLVFLVLSPSGMIDECKKLVQKVEQLTKDEAFHEKLRAAKTKQEALQAMDIEI